MFAALALLLAAACSGPLLTAKSPPAEKVAVATLGASSDAAIYIGIEKGYFAEQGIEVQPVSFKVVTDILPALVNRQVDVGTGAPTAGLFNALAGGIPVKIVASNARLEPGRDGGAFVLRKGVADMIASAADLKHRNIALTSRGGITGQVLLDRILSPVGLSESDVNVVLIPGFPETLTAMATGQIDGALLPEPWVSLGVAQDQIVVWKPFAEIAPSMENNLLVYSDEFATQRSDVARRFMVARLKAVRDYEAGFSGGRDRTTLVSILTRYTPITDPAIYARMSFSEMDPDGRVDEGSLEQLQDWYADHGYVSQRADLNAALDSSFTDYATSALGTAR